MNPHHLERTYLLRGLDRHLYRVPPAWPEGTFVQNEEESGRLVLGADEITSPEVLASAIKAMDLTAERFRLAIARRIVSPLTIRLERSREPIFDPTGVATARDFLQVSDAAVCTTAPREPPGKIEQDPVEAGRWILTLTEARTFQQFPDEVLKRLYLLIEELKDLYVAQLSDEQRGWLPQLKSLRDFVSHPECESRTVCEFIVQQLPSAVISTNPLCVRFDRSNVEHRNFIGRFEPKASSVAHCLLSAAIAHLPK